MRIYCAIAFYLLQLCLFSQQTPSPEKEIPAISAIPTESAPSKEIPPQAPVVETKPAEPSPAPALAETKPVESSPASPVAELKQPVETPAQEPPPPPLVESKPNEPPASDAKPLPSAEIPSARIPLLLPVIEPKPVQTKPPEKGPLPAAETKSPKKSSPSAAETKPAPAKPLEPKSTGKKPSKTSKKLSRPHRKPRPVYKKPVTTPPARLPLFVPLPALQHKGGASTDPAKPPTSKTSKISYPIPKRLTLSHNTGYGENSGVYQGSSYTTFGVLLASDYTVGSFYPLIDLRANRFDNDTYAFNIGAGGRYILANTFCEILGFNMYYDWRQGSLNEYNQLGLGLEILGRRWDFRANGYFPVGAKTYQLTCNYQYDGGYEITHQRHEITTYGFNAEVGWLAIASKNFLFYTAAGPYYLTRNSCCFEPIRGGRVRVRPQYKDYIALDASYSYDSNFNSVWELTFIIYLPLYQITNQNERPCRLTDRQIYQPIERFEIMPLGRRSCWRTNF